jgi:DNA modification methylase
MSSKLITHPVGVSPYFQDNLTTIYHAKCEDIVDLISGIDLLLTDPPYGIKENHTKNNSRTNAAAVKDYGEYNWDQAPPSDELISRCRKTAEKQIIFGGNYFTLPPTSCWLVWDKKTTGDFADCELAWTNLKKAVRRIEYLWNGMIKAAKEERFHPTQKPVKVMQWCIKQAGCVSSVIDPFMGSGTTLLAARQLGIPCVGIDREERYCEIAAKRVENTSFRPLSEALESGNLF